MHEDNDGNVSVAMPEVCRVGVKKVQLSDVRKTFDVMAEAFEFLCLFETEGMDGEFSQ